MSRANNVHANSDTDEEFAKSMKHINIEVPEPTEPQLALIERLRGLDTRFCDLNGEFERELVQLRLKYEKLYSPIFQERSQLLTTSEDAATTENHGTPALPFFWVQALKQHPHIEEMLESQDIPVLTYLRNIEVEYHKPDDIQSFTLVFTFAPNPFFENTVLRKSYDVSKEGSTETLNFSSSTEIQWKEGKDCTKEIKQRKQKNKRTQATRTITEVKECPSFFNFFRGHKVPTDTEILDMDEEDVEELELLIEADYAAAQIMKDRIINHAILWYLGEGVDSDLEGDYGMEDDDEEGEEGEEEEDDEEEGDDEEGDSDGDHKKKGHKNKHRGGNAGAAAGNPNNCQQQ